MADGEPENRGRLELVHYPLHQLVNESGLIGRPLPMGRRIDHNHRRSKGNKRAEEKAER